MHQDDRDSCLAQEEKLAAQLIAEKAALRQPAHQNIRGTEVTKKRQTIATSTSQHGSIFKKKKKVSSLLLD
jgi:hypothetical protein